VNLPYEPALEAAQPGRSCPLGYRYGAASLARPGSLSVDTLWVAGGLYGNRHALDRLLELYAAERGSKALVFNGDFHWFDADEQDFASVNRAVLAERATRGNVETELADPHARAGCGCGYPDWVGDEEVARSNRIIERLRAAARRLPGELARLRELPMTLVAQVAGERVAVVHGDAESLAGWNFSQEMLATPAGLQRAEQAFRDAQVRVFASSHSCLPVMQRIGDALIANNGAAGMPNFSGAGYGLATRLSHAPDPRAIYGTRLGELFVDAVAIDYDQAGWRKRFLAQWPAGSDAHRSYFTRIVEGPRYERHQAVRCA
jgi:predicted phosphodiesterase